MVPGAVTRYMALGPTTYYLVGAAAMLLETVGLAILAAFGLTILALGLTTLAGMYLFPIRRGAIRYTVHGLATRHKVHTIAPQ
jgi:hypothetical protein